MKSILTLALVAGLMATAGNIPGAAAQQPAADTGRGGGPGYGMMNRGITGPGMMSPGMMGGGMMGWGGHGAAMCAAMAGHIDGRLAYAKAELKITDAQEVLWKAYAEAARANAQAMNAHCTAMMGKGDAKPIPLPDRLDQHEQFMSQQLDAMRAADKALKPLYAAFSDTQKQAADDLFQGMMGMM